LKVKDGSLGVKIARLLDCLGSAVGVPVMVAAETETLN